MGVWGWLGGQMVGTLALHALLSRIWRAVGSVQGVALQAIGIGWGVGLTGGVISLGMGEAWAYLALCGFCWGYIYFHFFNMTETARRIRLMYAVREGRWEEIRRGEGYDAERMLKMRLDRLEQLGQVSVVEGRYRLKARGRLLYAAASMLAEYRKLLGL
jgi:hypothetical protein